MQKTNKKRNWKYVRTGDRDIHFFRVISEQKFLRRPEAIEFIFDGKKNYAETRIQKLKRFGHIKAMRLLAGHPENYLLGEAGVEALRMADYMIGNLGFPIVLGRTLPRPQNHIELACYEHDVKVTQARFLFEGLRLCKDWHSEKFLKMGTTGERKVPDGFFTRNGKGIAIEVELNEKKAQNYRKIFRVYTLDSKIHYIFYLCGNLALMRKIMRLAEEACVGSQYCFILFDELMHFKRDAIFRTADGKGKFKLKEVLS